MIASLVVISVVWCLARCLCCGLSCCCSCFSCCESCCPSGRRQRGSKYNEGPGLFHSAPYQGYQPTPAPPAYEPPRFATFDAPTKSGRLHDDALPAMPSWDNASTRKVEVVQHEDVEMGHLGPTTSQTAGVLNTAGRDGRSRYSGMPSGPRSSFDERPGTTYHGPNAALPYAPSQGAGEMKVDVIGGYNSRTSQAYGPGTDASYGQPAPAQDFTRTSYGHTHTGTPASLAQPYTDFNHNQSHSSTPTFGQSQQGNMYHAPTQGSYSTYTPSTSTRYEPSTYQPQGDR